jgi:carbon-monoxide dehydrogenase medium subunit
MRPRPFEYYAPSSLSEALALLASKEESKVLAGGQSLITLMKLRLAAPGTLIDINGIPELTDIREEDGMIIIGALSRHDQLAGNNIIRQRCLLLSEAASAVADQQVRNRGTIGGSLAHADPGADLPTACTALGATILARSVNGSRSIKSTDFFRGFFTTALEQDEIIQEVRVPIPPPGSGGAYLKLTRGHNDFAIVAVAAQLTIGSDDVCSSASLVVGGVGSTPLHAENAEKSLVGRSIDERMIEEASQKASEGLSPPSDIRASAEYRLKMAKVLTERAVGLSVSRAHGGA